jgi:tRNA pseudouridine55 synthase
MSIHVFDGLLVVDKPSGMTSRDVVNRAARWFPPRTRLGHTGTLDPLATGVLVLCIGAATRLTEYIQRMGKIYEAGILLGFRSDTDDADGTVTPVAGVTAPTQDQLDVALRPFIGRIAQVPPVYSAAKVAGRRAYKLARRAEAVDLAPRQVEIGRIDIERYAFPHLRLEVHCGKGTYIRSLARDLGQSLGCGAIIESLRRTSVGCFTTDQAVGLDAEPEQVHAHLLPPASAVEGLPPVTLQAKVLDELRQGKRVPVPVALDYETAEVAIFDQSGKLAAIAVVNADEKMLRPVKVLPMKDNA